MHFAHSFWKGVKKHLAPCVVFKMSPARHASHSYWVYSIWLAVVNPGVFLGTSGRAFESLTRNPEKLIGYWKTDIKSEGGRTSSKMLEHWSLVLRLAGNWPESLLLVMATLLVGHTRPPAWLRWTAYLRVSSSSWRNHPTVGLLLEPVVETVQGKNTPWVI